MIDDAAKAAPLGRQLDALGFATRKHRQFQITQAQFGPEFQLAQYSAFFGEKLHAFFEREFQYFGDVAASPPHFERLFSIASAFARRTGDFDVRGMGSSGRASRLLSFVTGIWRSRG
ncbi:MAG TPA: hypothetical protein PLX89_14850 [Verrucomicrobiota bacterium]|nr:hypothetical protein [Verrucomicrobiales bacterium]HRI14270.1 hypothetical protein [Verrucomicrobiota bacterium]